ncbi:uncharacterized protein LOC116939100 [Petromyzon marinus]
MITKQLFAPLNSAGHVFLLLFHVAVATSATVLNALGIAALMKARLPLKQNRFVYVLSTCTSDLCCGVSWFYAGIFDVDDASGKLDTCFIQPSFVGVSCMCVLFSQLDRYYAIKSPFSYVQRVTWRKTLAAVSLCWLLPVLPIVLINVGPKSSSTTYQVISTLLTNMAMFVIMGAMNVKLCLIARSHAKRASRQPNERDTGARSSYSVIIVAMVDMVLWSPSYIYLVVCLLFNLCPRFPNYGLNPITILRTLTSITTPAINIACSNALRTSISSLLPRWCKANARVDVNENGQSAIDVSPPHV